MGYGSKEVTSDSWIKKHTRDLYKYNPVVNKASALNKRGNINKK